MAEKSVFEQIKKQNGEQFAKAIRAYDNGIFEIPNIVDIVKYAGRESEPIMAFLISLKDIQIEENSTNKDPFELLSEAGYDAYYVRNLEEQNKISKYFKRNEMLCTFRDPTRFQKYHIINAVKKNVDEIKRKDFRGKEKREDAYGTSVISIQILIHGGFISIKNRYNHTVTNPDNTFNSNPDNIINGLSASLKNYLKVDFSSQKVRLPNYFISINNQIIRYNYEINNIYFGRDFYVKDGHISSLDKNTEIMLDSCILNTRNRTLYDPSVCREPIYIDDVTENSGTFMSVLALELKDKKIQIQKNKDGGHDIYANKDRIASVQEGKIMALNLPNTTEIGDDFLMANKSLQELSLPNLTTVGDSFLLFNESLQELSLPNLTTVGGFFLRYNNSLQELNLPNLTTVRVDFLSFNKSLQKLSLPNLTTVGGDFLRHNKSLQELSLPKLTTVGYDFLYNNKSLRELSLPKLERTKASFLFSNESLQELSLPNLTTVGGDFLRHNKSLRKSVLKKLKKSNTLNTAHEALPDNKNAGSLKTTLKNAVIKLFKRPFNPSPSGPNTGNLPDKGGR